jgi:hypothetical protein
MPVSFNKATLENVNRLVLIVSRILMPG